MYMHIVMITGSPHKKGTSALLADEFIRGQKKKETLFIALILLLNVFIHVLDVRHVNVVIIPAYFKMQ